MSELPKTRDHSPSKVLLDRPYPENLAITTICQPCNNGFSLDEEYLSTVLSCVLSGTTDPNKQKVAQAGKALARNRSLRALIESQKVEQFCLFGGVDVQWFPDMTRIIRVILKNARAHLFYENGEPMLDAPKHLSIHALPSMRSAQITEFFHEDQLQPWGEVGSRWNSRLVGDDSFDEAGFVVLQPGVYRFRIEAGGLGVRSVMREYLATTVFW